MEVWKFERGGKSLWYAKKELISPSHPIWQLCFHSLPLMLLIVSHFRMVSELQERYWLPLIMYKPQSCWELFYEGISFTTCQHMCYKILYIGQAFSNHGESEYVLISMNWIKFDKLWLLALVKPTWLARKPDSCNTQEAVWFLSSKGCFITTGSL